MLGAEEVGEIAIHLQDLTLFADFGAPQRVAEIDGTDGVFVTQGEPS